MKNKFNSVTKSDLNIDHILKSRADLLSRENNEGANGKDHIQILSFKLASETYGIELCYIRVIYPLKDLTYIPGVPDFIMGIINMRGEIISVIDLKKIFDLPQTPPNRHQQAIILSSDEIELGIYADQLLEVKQIEEAQIQPTLPTLTGVRAQYLKGLASDGMVILDGEKILSDKSLLVNIGDTQDSAIGISSL